MGVALEPSTDRVVHAWMSKGAVHRLKAKVKGGVEVSFTRVVATGADTWDVAGTVRLTLAYDDYDRPFRATFRERQPDHHIMVEKFETPGGDRDGLWEAMLQRGMSDDGVTLGKLLVGARPQP